MEGLRRTLGANEVLVLTLSALSPVRSVFITGSVVLHMAGTGAAAALLLGGLIAILATFLYAELGAAFPRAGGVYPGISAVLGERLGFVAIALGLVAAPASLALGSLGLADYLKVLAPDLPALPIAFVALGGAALTAILNIRLNAWIAAAMLAVEGVGLAVLTFAGAHAHRSLGSVLLHPVMLGAHHGLIATPLSAMPLSTLSGAFACSGAGLAIYFAEEMRGEPRRIGGVVALIGFGAALLVSLPLVLLVTAAPNLTAILSADAPVAAFLTSVAGSSISRAITALVALAILNNIVASLLAFSRFLYSTGRDAVWPSLISAPLAHLHRRFGSPWVASLVIAAAAAVLCLVGERGLLVLLSGDVFTATLVVVSVLIGRRRGRTGATSFRAPLFPFTPLLALAIVAGIIAADWQDTSAGRPSLFLLSAVAVCAFGLHSLASRRKARRAAGSAVL